MSNAKIECYVIPSLPLPVLLPVECVAEIVKKPIIEPLSKAPTSWMKGHVNWQNQRLPLMSFESLLVKDVKQPDNTKPSMVVLNAIPDAARKAYSGLLCYGDIDIIEVDSKVEYAELPKELDKRYVESVLRFDKKEYIVPKLTSLAVAFTYLN
jgi:chemotaxis signal transduction protein